MKIVSSPRNLLPLWLILFPAFLVLWYWPDISLRIRLITWATAALLLAGSIYFSWKSKILRTVLLGLCGAVILFLLWPSHRSADRSTLRTDYCAALKSYSGCRYVWGGEGYFGIDCSGFVRKGLEDSLASRGFLTLSPALVRESISLYWHDTTAKVIGEGYAGRTETVTTCRMLNTMDYASLLPGDLAVTSAGEHIMAYLGDKTWIAADPTEGKVTTFVIPEKKNAYFSTPMRIVRWKILSK
jgi:hypothetical protein